MLYQWGSIIFDVMPLNVHEYEETGRSEFAKKEILGVQPPREFTGDDDDELFLRGRYYPNKVGGLTEYELFDQLRKKGLPQLLVRGDGRVKGWYVCVQLRQQGTYLRADGIGQVVNFEAQFFKAGAPGADDYFSQLYSITSGQ